MKKPCAHSIGYAREDARRQRSSKPHPRGHMELIVHILDLTRSVEVWLATQSRMRQNVPKDIQIPRKKDKKHITSTFFQFWWSTTKNCIALKIFENQNILRYQYQRDVFGVQCLWGSGQGPGQTIQHLKFACQAKYLTVWPRPKALLVQHSLRASSKKFFEDFQKHYATNFACFCFSSNVWSFGHLFNVVCQTFLLFLTNCNNLQHFNT